MYNYIDLQKKKYDRNLQMPASANVTSTHMYLQQNNYNDKNVKKNMGWKGKLLKINLERNYLAFVRFKTSNN